MNNICHVTLLYKPYFAGHAVYLEKRVFREFHKKGLRNIVITANYDDLLQYEMIDSVDVYRIPIKKNSKKWNLIFSIKAIYCMYKIRNSFDIIHLQGLWDVYGIFTIFSKLFRKKVVLHMTLLGNDDPIAITKSYKFMQIRFKLISYINAFISISTPMSDSYRKTILPIDRLHQIPQGVDTKSFLPVSSQEEKNNIKSSLRLPMDEKLVIFVGTIMERKGVDILLEAWKMVNEKINSAHLLLVGPDTFDGFDTEVAPLVEFCNNMKNIVSQQHMNVTFIGRSNDVPLYLKASDLFVLPSRKEGFGNVVIEAMSAGLPVIISEMDGIAYDLIINGKQGYIVKSIDELANRIIFLLENEDISKSMGISARERALTKFEIGNICNEYIKVYKS